MPVNPYNPPLEQVRKLCSWNRYFPDKKIVAMLDTVPAFGQDGRLALTLCRTLSTLALTVAADIEIMRCVFKPNKLFVSPRLSQFASSDICLPEGAPKFVPFRLWWEVIYLGANRNKAPDQVDPATAAGTQVLSAVYNHPAAVLRHNGRTNPYWDIPGLRVKIPGQSEPFAPYIFGDGADGVHLDTGSAGVRRLRYAEPKVVNV